VQDLADVLAYQGDVSAKEADVLAYQGDVLLPSAPITEIRRNIR
jgi:hypothetical protein